MILSQENKELLLKDLCAKLPYGGIIQYPNIFRPSEVMFEDASDAVNAITSHHKTNFVIDVNI